MVRRLIEIAVMQGASRDALWSAAGVSPAIDDGARVPAARLFELWLVAARQAPPHLPLAVTHEITIEQFGVFGFAILTAPDCVTALKTVSRLFPIVTDSGRWLPQLRDRSLVVLWDRSPSRCAGQHLSTEATLAHFVSCARQTFGEGAPRLKRVSLRHPVAPDQRAALRDYFDCALELDADCDALEWDRELIDATPRFANPAMHEHFIAVAAPLASAVATPPSYAELVRAQLRQRIADGEPPMTEVARSLGVSSRTLRRRLADERISWHGLVDQVRRELASNLLAHTNASITHVALDLGFSDSTAFARAHRRWHGKSPRAARTASGRVRG